MEIQNIRVHHCKNCLEVWIITKAALQTVEVWHCLGDLSIGIKKLVKYIGVAARQLLQISNGIEACILGPYLEH